MTIRKVPIDMVSATWLAEYVGRTFNIEVNRSLGHAGIIAKLSQAGLEHQFVQYDDGVDEAAIQNANVRRDPAFKRHKEGKRFALINIPVSDRPGGNEPVPIICNGVAIIVPRGKDSWIDYKYVHILDNAVAHIAETGSDSEITGYRLVPEHPYTMRILEPPLTKAEKLAEQAREEKRLADLKAEREEMLEGTEEDA